MSLSISPSADPAGAALAASRILTAALTDLAAKQGRPPLAAPADHAAPALLHVIETDPERFLLARDGERPVAFGAAFTRGPLSYCAGLFVLPDYQGRGLGRRLFEAALEGLPVAGGVAALTSSAANPISNGLYARHDVFPQHALLYLTGPLPAPQTPPSGNGSLDIEPLTAEHLGELREIDLAVLEADRTIDHQWFLGLSGAGHPGWLFRRHGRAAGYAYLGGDGTEGAGALGPVATLRAQDQGQVLQFALARLAALGVAEATVAVPGPNLVAQRLLWQAGFSFSGATGLFCASRPFGRFDRYLLAGDCLM